MSPDTTIRYPDEEVSYARRLMMELDYDSALIHAQGGGMPEADIYPFCFITVKVRGPISKLIFYENPDKEIPSIRVIGGGKGHPIPTTICFNLNSLDRHGIINSRNSPGYSVTLLPSGTLEVTQKGVNSLAFGGVWGITAGEIEKLPVGAIFGLPEGQKIGMVLVMNPEESEGGILVASINAIMACKSLSKWAVPL